MDYEKQTKAYYQNDDKAVAYHRWYTSAGGLNGMRFRYMADKERAAVRALAARVPHGGVIDVPAGTGKMAPVFRELGSRVLACDVSQNMLSIAEAVYREEGVASEFMVLDLERATEVIDRRFDLTVCVRLMHRVPDDVKRRMLDQISRLSPAALVSFAVDSPYERLRGRLRRMLLSRGSDTEAMHAAVRTTWPSRAALEELLSASFDIVAYKDVSRLLSSETMYLLRSRVFPG